MTSRSSGGTAPIAWVRGLSLRGTLLLLVLVAALYVAAGAVIIATRIGPRARALGEHSRQVLAAYEEIRARDVALESAIVGVRARVARRATARAPGADRALDSLARFIRGEVDSAVVVRAASDLAAIPQAMRISLSRAASNQADVSVTLLETLAMVQLGRWDEAGTWLARADSLEQVAHVQLSAAQRLGLVDIVVREQALGSTARAIATATGWWALVGLLLLPAAALLVHRRFYRPLAALDGAFARLASGDLAATVPVSHADEMGRLAQHFNRMTAIVRSRTEEQQRQSEQAIAASDLQLRTVWDASADGMRLTDAGGTVVRVNEALCRIIGLPRAELEGKPLTAAYDPGRSDTILQKHIQRFRGELFRQQYEQEVMLWNGRRIWLEVATSMFESPGHEPLLLSVIRDVTERKRLEEQLRQSQKMDAVGRLAGGIAHDFNNILGAIVAYAELARGALAQDDPVADDVAQIEVAARRAGDLTRQLLAFARRQMLELRVVDLNALVDDLDKMLRRLIGETITLVTRRSDLPCTVKVDPGQFEQVLVNLVVNARDAMPHGGRLTIEIRNVDLDEAYADGRPGVTPGPYVLLAVSDTGTGMTEEVQRQIFEPFFTTKERGKGTGLGLATCYGIVRQAGGHLWVYSEPGRGSTFKVYIPRSTEAVTAPAPAEHHGPAPTGSETILLVEDEAMLREAVARSLREHGYRVLSAASGEEALDVARLHAEPIDLLVTDVVLPVMGGRQVADLLRASHAGLKVLFVSGYTEDAVVNHGILEAGIQFLPKPFTPAALARRVRRVLAG